MHSSHLCPLLPGVSRIFTVQTLQRWVPGNVLIFGWKSGKCYNEAVYQVDVKHVTPSYVILPRVRASFTPNFLPHPHDVSLSIHCPPTDQWSFFCHMYKVQTHSEIIFLQTVQFCFRGAVCYKPVCLSPTSPGYIENSYRNRPFGPSSQHRHSI